MPEASADNVKSIDPVGSAASRTTGMHGDGTAVQVLHSLGALKDHPQRLRNLLRYEIEAMADLGLAEPAQVLRAALEIISGGPDSRDASEQRGRSRQGT